MIRNRSGRGVRVATLALTVMAMAGIASAQDRPRVAVIAFKNQTSWWGQELGASAASQLTTRLVQSGTFSVLERDRVKAVFDEWYLAQSGAVDQSKAAQMGKLSGVEYLITGEFQSFNIRERRVGLGSLGVNQIVAESAINVRAISVATGEVVASAGHKGSRTLGQGGQFRGRSYSSLTANSAYNPTVAEDALSEALDKIAADLTAQRSRFPTAPATQRTEAPAGPTIVGVNADGTVYIDQGQNAGMTVGRRFHLLRVVDVIKDAQGNELDEVTRRMGIVEVTQVLGRSSIAKVIEGKPEAKDLLEPN